MKAPGITYLLHAVYISGSLNENFESFWVQWQLSYKPFNLDLVTCRVMAAGFAAAVGCDLGFNPLFIALNV